MNAMTQYDTPLTRGNKVPEVTLVFWIIKMMSTTIGETAADFLNADLGFGLGGTSLAVGALFCIALSVQMRARRYAPVTYWVAVLLISVFGTLVTDNLTDVLQVPLAWSSAGFLIILLLVFAAWFKREGTLSIHHVDTPAREAFYWVAILATFALGTAAGDWFAEGLGLGYWPSAAIFGAAIAIVAIIALLRWRTSASTVACFWIAYVLTRPFGAALGDGLAQGPDNGGLGLGTTWTSVLFLAVVIVLVAGLVRSRKMQLARAGQ